MTALAEKLKQLAPDSIEALLAQALIQLRDLNWGESLSLYREALDRYPGRVDANIMYGTMLYFLDDLEQSAKYMEAGLALDPLSPEAVVRLMTVRLQMGDCSILENLAARALELEPGFGRVRGYVGLCLLINDADAAQTLSWFDEEPVGFIRRTGRSIALHRMDRAADAADELNSMMSDYGDTASYQYAQVYAQWGNTESALDWLQTALDVGDPGSLNIGVDHLLDPIRQESRFADLMQQSGLADCCEIPD